MYPIASVNRRSGTRSRPEAPVALFDEFVGCRSLHGHPALRLDGLPELPHRECLSVFGAGFACDVLFDQGAPHIVDPQGERFFRRAEADFRPGHLNVFNVAPEEKPRDRVEAENVVEASHFLDPIRTEPEFIAAMDVIRAEIAAQKEQLEAMEANGELPVLSE